METNQLGHIIGNISTFHMKSLRLEYVARIRITQVTRYAVTLPHAMWAKQDLQCGTKDSHENTEVVTKKTRMWI